MGTRGTQRDEPACTEPAGSIAHNAVATERLHALLEETDAALAECLERLERLCASQAPAEVQNGLVGLKGLLKVARVDLTTYYARREDDAGMPSSNGGRAG